MMVKGEKMADKRAVFQELDIAYMSLEHSVRLLKGVARDLEQDVRYARDGDPTYDHQIGTYVKWIAELAQELAEKHARVERVLAEGPPPPIAPISEEQLEVLRSLGAQPEQLEELDAKTGRQLYDELIGQRQWRIKMAAKLEVDKIAQQKRDAAEAEWRKLEEEHLRRTAKRLEDEKQEKAEMAKDPKRLAPTALEKPKQ
jgi:hypothetical protein